MDRLREFLQDNKLSQAEFARRLDYHPELISMVLSGKRPASNGLKLRFIEAFGLDAYRSVFVGDVEPAEVPA